LPAHSHFLSALAGEKKSGLTQGPLFLGLDHIAAHVVAAIGTHDVGRHGRTAFWAIRQLPRLQGVVRSSFSGPGIGMFAFGDSHFIEPLSKLPVSLGACVEPVMLDFVSEAVNRGRHKPANK